MKPATTRIYPPLGAGLIALLLTLGACSDGSDRPDQPAKPQAANPLVEGPVSGGGAEDCCKLIAGPIEIDLSDYIGYTRGTPFYAGLYFDEAELGYRETEYFISGEATSYSATDELGEDGVWSVQPADSESYKSRIVVLRPDNPDDFNGTVVVEWFNVSGGVDAAPELVQTHTELIREGYAWVGVSAQSVGVEGGGAFEAPLKMVDPERYGSLSHPGDSFSYDIYSQAAQAVRNPMGLDPLDGLQVQYMIGMGESQSAGRMVTYINAIHPTIDLFDGFLVHSRGNRSASLSQEPQLAIPTPQPTLFRTDIPEPIIGVETESDILRGGAAVDPQPDADNYRLWEVAGNAHYDAYGVVKGPVDRGGDPSVAEVIESRDAGAAGLIECDRPINDGPAHWVLKAGVAALDNWIRSGEPAPSAAPIARNAAGTGLRRDQYGNVIDGVRTPYVDAPVAAFSGSGQTGTSFCFLFGTTALFDAATLATLYPDRRAYIEAIDAATDSAVERGFVLPADAELIKAQARNSDLFAQ